MSKAFTKEDSAPEAPLSRPQVRLSPGEARYITPEGFARKLREMKELESAEGPPELRLDAKGRAAALRSLLGVLTVAEPTADYSHVAFGAWVLLEDEEGQHVLYRLVGPDEVDVKAGEISIESPIARALVGRGIGDAVVVHLPRGWREFTVVEIRATPPESTH